LSKVIIADTGPLIAFGLINKFSILAKLFETIIIPQTVADECLADKTWPGAPTILQAVSNKIIQIHPDPSLVKSDDLLNILDKGEAAAIKLAHSLNIPLIIDEKLGRSVAKNLGIKVIGTVGILLLAKQRNLIKKIKPIIMLLKNEGYYLSDALIKEILTHAKEI